MRREIYEELGGFVRHTIFNEDMIYAAKAVEAGYSVAYAADAQVVHSHNYTNGQQFHRNFDLGVSQAEHPEIFAAYPSESEGKSNGERCDGIFAQQPYVCRIAPFLYAMRL